MAIYWNLGLLARDRATADACVAFFAAQELAFGGEIIPLEVSSTEVLAGVLVGVWPRGMSYGSPSSNNYALVADDACTRIAASFDGWLREAPPFAFAWFGAEAYDALLDDLADLTEGFGGLFCDEHHWNATGRDPLAERVSADRYTWPRTRLP